MDHANKRYRRHRDKSFNDEKRELILDKQVIKRNYCHKSRFRVMECEFEYRFALRELQMKIMEVRSLLNNNSNFLADCLQLRP